MYPNLVKENRRMSTCNWMDLQTLGSQPIMPKISPINDMEDVVSRWARVREDNNS